MKSGQAKRKGLDRNSAPTSVDENLVREKAERLWIDRGMPSGKDLEIWLDAEKMVKKEFNL